MNPCNPSPCGPNSLCRIVSDHPVCSCLENTFGNPPNCHYECLVNSDCSQEKVCSKGKCISPCLQLCGKNAICTVYNHNPTCHCMHNYEGDPFTQCHEIQSKIININHLVLKKSKLVR